MKYSELLESVTCQYIIIFEDDFKLNEFKKEDAVYYLTRMNLRDREEYLIELRDVCPNLAEQLTSYFSLCDPLFENIDNWENSVPRSDIRPAFTQMCKSNSDRKDELLGCYDAIDETQLQDASNMGLKYGIGVTYPAYFDSLFEEYLLKDNRSKPFRLYQNFNASTKLSLENDLKHTSDENSIVCIIDNNLGGTNRAKEIVDTIAAISRTERKNIIGSIFSSNEKFEEINDLLYFEFAPKASPEKLKACIAKSAYNYFIAKLQKETIGTLSNAFARAISSKDIAYYLSHRAFQEGTSEYQIIMEWVRLMCSPQKENGTAIKHLITLSRVINSLDDMDDIKEQLDSSLEIFNTLEAFDYTINDYYLPVMPGDIFTNSRGEWFVLIGQDCDMMRRGDGEPPKNAIAEFLSARVYPQIDTDKVASDLEKVSISNFRKSLDNPNEILQILYKVRKHISNEIINLSSFNEDGACRLPLDEKLSAEKRKLMPKHMIDYYEHLQRFYKSVLSLREKSEEDFNTVISQAFSRVISFDEIHHEDGCVCSDYRRVCRLTHNYVYYLYKLYLEYRGRQPFQSINFVRKNRLSWPIIFNGQSTEVYLQFLCYLAPLKTKIHKLNWIIEAHEINRVFKNLGINVEIEKDITLTDTEYVNCVNGITIKIKKLSQYKVDISISQ